MDLSNVRSEDLKCILVEMEDALGNGIIQSYMTWRDFHRSFIKERWENERRYGECQTLFGMAHRKMTVRFSSQTPISRRWFTFPKSMHQAQQLHIENCKKD